jgi:hypothetical protein
VTCEALEMECSTKSSDKLASEVCAALSAHSLLLHSSTGSPATTSSWPFCQLLLVVHLRQPIWCFQLLRGISRFYIRVPSVRWICLLRLVRRIVIVECTIGRGHRPVLRWETHPNSLEGLPPGISMPALLYCRRLAVAQEHTPISGWRCCQLARQVR